MLDGDDTHGLDQANILNDEDELAEYRELMDELGL